MMDIRFTGEENEKRQAVWMDAWKCTAEAANTIDTRLCAQYADECLKDFDERFHSQADK